MTVVEFKIGDVLRLRKQHPCGNDLWQVVRLEADIGIKCMKCQHYVLIDRVVLDDAHRLDDVGRVAATRGFFQRMVDYARRGSPAFAGRHRPVVAGAVLDSVMDVP